MAMLARFSVTRANVALIYSWAVGFGVACLMFANGTAFWEPDGRLYAQVEWTDEASQLDSRRLCLYDVDRFHLLFKEYCQDNGMAMQYLGCMSVSKWHAGIQTEAPAASTLWKVITVDPQDGERLADADVHQVLFQIAPASDETDEWTFRISESLLTLKIADNDAVDEGTSIRKGITINGFVSGFRKFSEERMKNYRYGMKGLPRE